MRTWVLAIGLLAAAVCAGGLQGEGSTGLTKGPVSPEELDRLIADLGNSSYEKRTEATRNLCAIGMQAYQPLEEVARSGNAEAALRAGVLLRTLDRLLFSGVQVELAFSRASIAWNEPVALFIRLHNATPWPARIPFDSAPAETEAEAGQLGLLLDVADWLYVEGPDGSKIELYTDDYAPHSSLARVVEDRLDDPPVSVLGPGERRELKLEEFNRGWGRFRMLDAGRYSVRLDYDPPWSDPVLLENHVGRVVSNVATIKVTESAPDSVSRAGVAAGLSVEQSDGDLVVAIRNRKDVPLWVGTDFGADSSLARGTWVYSRGEEFKDIAQLSPSARTGKQKPELREIPPGQTLEILRVPLRDVLMRLQQAGADVDGEQWSLAFRYWNPPLDPVPQMGDENGSIAPAPQRSAQLRRVLTTQHISNRLIAPRGARSEGAR